MLSANSCSGIRLLTVAHSILLCIVYEDNVAYAFWLHTDFIIYTIPPHHVFFFALDWIVLNDLFIARCPSVCELSWSSIVLVGAIRKKKQSCRLDTPFISHLKVTGSVYNPSGIMRTTTHFFFSLSSGLIVTCQYPLCKSSVENLFDPDS